MQYTFIITLFASAVFARNTMKIGGVDIVGRDHPDMIKDEYYIVFHKSTNATTIDAFHARTNSIQDKLQRGSRFKTSKTVGLMQHISIGDAKVSYGSYSPDMLATLARDPAVDYIHVSSIIRQASVATGEHYSLERISAAKLSHPRGDYTDSSFTYRYPALAGAGVNVYVMDSGIDTTHTDFEGRATWGYVCDGQKVDGTTHGTQVAGIIGSKSRGVAPKANLIAVKVISSNGTGKPNDIIAGFKYIESDAPKRKGTSVVNMSFDSAYNQALNDLVTELIKMNIVVVTSAGNQGEDASKASPGSAPGVINVGATDETDARWADPAFGASDFGPALTCFAPGVDVGTVCPGNQFCETYFGTSFAAPQVAGIAALVIAQNGGTAAVADVKNTIVQRANNVNIANAGAGSPLKMAYNGGEAGLPLIPVGQTYTSTTTTTSSTTPTARPSTTSSITTTAKPTTTSSTTSTTKPSTTSSATSTAKPTVTSATTTTTKPSTTSSTSSTTKPATTSSNTVKPMTTSITTTSTSSKVTTTASSSSSKSTTSSPTPTTMTTVTKTSTTTTSVMTSKPATSTTAKSTTTAKA